MDDSSESRGHVLGRWVYEAGIPLDFPRDEDLDDRWFGNVTEAQEIIENWRVDYNWNRPHSSLNYLASGESAVHLPLGGEDGDAKSIP